MEPKLLLALEPSDNTFIFDMFGILDDLPKLLLEPTDCKILDMFDVSVDITKLDF